MELEKNRVSTREGQRMNSVKGSSQRAPVRTRLKRPPVDCPFQVLGQWLFSGLYFSFSATYYDIYLQFIIYIISLHYSTHFQSYSVSFIFVCLFSFNLILFCLLITFPPSLYFIFSSIFIKIL